MDGEEIYRKDAGLLQTMGSESVPFTIEGEPAGRVEVRLMTLVVFLKVTVAGVPVLTT
jgi:hypothetical protein